MALRSNCHICSTAHKNLSEEMAFEITITSPEKVWGEKKRKANCTLQWQKVGACLLGKPLSDSKREDRRTLLRWREMPSPETVAVFYSPGPE